MSAQPTDQAQARSALLEVRDLCVHFEEGARLSRAVDGISLELGRGETLALMGESGSGKSLTALSIMGLLGDLAGVKESGEVRFQGRSLRDPQQLAAVRGDRLAMIFQDPKGAMNPVFSVGEQIAECLRSKRGLGRREAARRAVEALGSVGIAAPEVRARQYPHQLSGGMLQRAMIAMAMCTEPELLIADEPTTALDMTVQAEILALMRRLGEENEMGILLITHDMGVVAENADRVAVMYAGRIVEQASVAALLKQPGHPYSKLLLRSLPELAEPGARLPSIEGSVPPAYAFPPGCRFHTRCPLARERCQAEQPVLSPSSHGGRAACHFPEELPSL